MLLLSIDMKIDHISVSSLGCKCRMAHCGVRRVAAHLMFWEKLTRGETYEEICSFLLFLLRIATVIYAYGVVNDFKRKRFPTIVRFS